MALFREWGLVHATRLAYDQGTVISGASAGLNICFEWCTTDSIRTRIVRMPGLGLVKGAVCVHYDIREDRRRVFRELLSSEDVAGVSFGLDDGTAIHLVDGRLARPYTLQLNRIVRQFMPCGGEAIQEPVLLGAESSTFLDVTNSV